MSYTAPTLRSTGDLITASIWNTDIVNNIVAMFGGAMSIASQAANDLIYASTASQLARLAMPSQDGQILQSQNAGAPIWSSELRGFFGTSPNPAIAANVLTVDYKAGNVVRVSLNANITTMTLNNVAASGKFSELLFVVTADGSARTWAWLTSTVKWTDGTTPALTVTAGKVDVYHVWTVDGGTTWYGVIVQQNMG